MDGEIPQWELVRGVSEYLPRGRFPPGAVAAACNWLCQPDGYVRCRAYRTRRGLQFLSRAIGPATAASPDPYDDWMYDEYDETHLDSEPEVDTYPFVRVAQCVFGNPLRSPAFDSAWRTDAAIGVATRAYRDRRFDALPVLADALQDAGCEDDEILSHCRYDGGHARGCWVVDRVLGRE